MESKICTRCGVSKSLEEFYKLKTGKLGRAARCIECTLIVSKEKYKYWRDTKEERAKFSSELIEEGLKICPSCKSIKPFLDFYPDKRSPSGLTSSCKDCYKVSGKKYRQENSDKVKARHKQYNENNKHKASAYGKAYRKANKERIDAYFILYKEIYHDKILESLKNHYNNNKEYYNLKSVNRRCLKAAAEGKITKKDIEMLIHKQDNKCPYCSADLSLNKNIDHWMPLSLGGSNIVGENIQLLCEKCNKSKGNINPLVYEEMIGFERNRYIGNMISLFMELPYEYKEAA